MGIVQQTNDTIEKERPEAAYGQRLHNRPPLDQEIVTEFKDQIDQRSVMAQRYNDVIASADRAVVNNDEDFGKCGELVKQIRAVIGIVNDVHKAVKEPYLAATRAIDGEKNDLIRPLDEAKAMVERKQQDYAREKQRLERERLAREAAERRHREQEERDRLAAEAANNADGVAPVVVDPEPAPVAPIEPPKPEIVRGTFGAAVSTGTKVVAVVEDYELAFMAVSGNIKVREAIDKAIAAMVKAGQREIPGVRLDEDVKISNR